MLFDFGSLYIAGFLSEIQFIRNYDCNIFSLMKLKTGKEKKYFIKRISYVTKMLEMAGYGTRVEKRQI